MVARKIYVGHFMMVLEVKIRYIIAYFISSAALNVSTGIEFIWRTHAGKACLDLYEPQRKKGPGNTSKWFCLKKWLNKSEVAQERGAPTMLNPLSTLNKTPQSCCKRKMVREPAWVELSSWKFKLPLEGLIKQQFFQWLLRE